MWQYAVQEISLAVSLDTYKSYSSFDLNFVSLSTIVQPSRYSPAPLVPVFDVK